MKTIWIKILISALALSLVTGCSDEPDRKLYESSEVSEIGTTSANSGEDTGTQSPPALTNKQFSEGSGGALDDHPLVTEDQKNVNRKIIVPKSVEGKWKAVKMLVRDKSDEERNMMQTVELGSTFQLGDSGITVNAVEFFPNFVLDQATYTSMDNILGNPAIHLVITVNGKELYNSWTFAKYPGLYAFEHPRYGLQLMDFIPMPTS